MIKQLDDINRNNGYLDLDSYLVEKYETLKINTLKKLKVIEADKYELYYVKINGENYIFKPCTKEQAIKELLASKMLEKVGFEHVEYDMAHIFGEYGVISKSYKKEGYNYISGDALISSYADLIDPNASHEHVDYNKYNNLESIWNILEVKYKYYFNKDAIIKTIMKRLTEKFVFDILIAQDDGAAYNWEIEENDKTANLVPLYDNGCMLDMLNPNLRIDEVQNIKVEETSSKLEDYSNLNEMKKFLRYSSDEFKTDFEFLMKYLTPEDIKWFLKEIESELVINIDTKIKNDIIAKYKTHYNDLQLILEEELYQKR